MKTKLAGRHRAAEGGANAIRKEREGCCVKPPWTG